MKFADLSYSAKEKVLNRVRKGMDYEWWDFVYDDAERIGKIIGIEVDKIYFSGFWSQGDGASFEGSYRYAKGSTKAIKSEAPQCKELHRIAKALQDAQRTNFYRLRAESRNSGRYSHSGCMRVNVEDRENPYRDIGAAEDDVTQALRDFADWIYSRLEKEYEYLTSEEQVVERDDNYDEEGNEI